MTAVLPLGRYRSPSPINAEEKPLSDLPTIDEAAVSTSGRHRSIGTSASETLIAVASSSSSRKAGGSVGKGGDIGARSLSPGRTDPPEVKSRGSGMPEREDMERYRAPPGIVNAVRNEKWLQRNVGSGSVVIAGADEKDYLGAARDGRKKEEHKGVRAFEKQSAMAPGKSRIVAEEEGLWLRGASEEIGEDSPHSRRLLSPSTTRSRSASPPPSPFQSPRAVSPLSRPSRMVQDVAISGDGFAAVNARSAANVPAGASITVGSVSAVDDVVSSMAVGVESRPMGARFRGDGRDEDLGMTRPRTATRRWDRPGPHGDNEGEVIAKALLSRLTVTSALSQR